MTNDSNPVFVCMLPRNSIIIADGLLLKFYAQSFIIILLFIIVELLFLVTPPLSLSLFIALSLSLFLHRPLPCFTFLANSHLYLPSSPLLSITRFHFPSIRFILHIPNNKQYLGKNTLKHSHSVMILLRYLTNFFGASRENLSCSMWQWIVTLLRSCWRWFIQAEILIASA